MTAPPLRTTLVLLTALLTALPVAGCGLSKGPVTVDTNLTEDYAQGRLITLVTNTLGALPASTSLGVQNPTPGRGSFPADRTVPCDDSDQTSTGPVNLQFERWVQNTQPDQVNTDLDAVAAAWQAAGLTVDDTKAITLRVVKMRTGDGYAVIAQSNDKGYYSVSGSSPCFLKANAGTTSPVPRTISHPA